MSPLTRLKRLTRLTGLGAVGQSVRWWESMPGQVYLTRDGTPYLSSVGSAYQVLPEVMAYLTTDQGIYQANDAQSYLTVGGYYAFDGTLYLT